MFSRIRRCILMLYGDPLPSIEEWSVKNSKLTTPEQIIEAAVIKSIAEHYDDWTVTPGDLHPEQANLTNHDLITKPPVIRTLRGPKVNVIIKYRRNLIRKIEYYSYDTYGFTISNCSVSDVNLGEQAARHIVGAHDKIRLARKAAEEAAAKAKAEMERNEKAWNLAEKLLGMKRNEFGALVPIKTVKEEVL